MSIQAQKKYFEVLTKYTRKFDPKELEDFKMLEKRHKDDEELDKLSLQRLTSLFEKYHLNRVKPNLDDLFKKSKEAGSDTN